MKHVIDSITFADGIMTVAYPNAPDELWNLNYLLAVGTVTIPTYAGSDASPNIIPVDDVICYFRYPNEEDTRTFQANPAFINNGADYPNKQALINAIAAATPAQGGGITRIIPTGGTNPSTSAATPQNVVGLSAPIQANTSYRGYGTLMFTSTGVDGGLGLTGTMPAKGATGHFGGWARVRGSAANPTFIEILDIDAQNTGSGASVIGAGVFMTANYEILFRTETAGTFQLRFRRHGNTQTIEILPGSYLKVEKL